MSGAWKEAGNSDSKQPVDTMAFVCFRVLFMLYLFNSGNVDYALAKGIYCRLYVYEPTSIRRYAPIEEYTWTYVSVFWSQKFSSYAEKP